MSWHGYFSYVSLRIDSRVSPLIFLLDAYFIVEWYVDQLDDEEMDRHAVVIPNSMAQPNIHNYGPSYAFSSPRNAYGVTAGQDPSNRVWHSEIVSAVSL